VEGSDQLYSPVALPPVKEPQVPVEWEAGWAPEPFQIFQRKEKSFASARSQTTIPQLPINS